MSVIHQRLQNAAAKDGMLERAAHDLDEVFQEQGLEKTALEPNELQLFIAYSTLEARSPKGETALDRVAPDASKEPELERAYQSLRRGGFAVMRIERIHLDEGLRVLELRSRKKLFIAERSGTRQVALGDMLLGWLCAEEDGTLTLEGHVTRVPPFFSENAITTISSLLPRGARRAGSFNAPAGRLPLELLVALQKLRTVPSRQGPDSRAPLDLPPELSTEMCRMVTEQIRSMLDAPIPQFRGKSLRQIARSKRSRPDAVSWLREQERILKTNPQLAEVDLLPIWQELGLEYQGLATDAARY